MKKWKMSLLIVFLFLLTALLSGEVNHAYAENDNADSQLNNDPEGALILSIWMDWEAIVPVGRHATQSAPVEVFAPLDRSNTAGDGLIQKKEVYVSKITNSSGHGGTFFSYVITRWDIVGLITPYPECFITIFVDEEHLGGFSTTCIPQGCSSVYLPPLTDYEESFFGFTFPNGEGYDFFDISKPGIYAGGYYANIKEMRYSTSSGVCEYDLDVLLP